MRAPRPTIRGLMVLVAVAAVLFCGARAVLKPYPPPHPVMVLWDGPFTFIRWSDGSDEFLKPGQHQVPRPTRSWQIGSLIVLHWSDGTISCHLRRP